MELITLLAIKAIFTKKHKAKTMQKAYMQEF